MNHYAFHIMDRDWGHMIARFCPHPPFNALVILNGHEWVAKEAERRRLAFGKQDNCFTAIQRPRLGPCRRCLELSRELCRAPSPSSGALDLLGGAVLCGWRSPTRSVRGSATYSLFQAEYSRNLLFTSGWLLRPDRLRGGPQGWLEPL